MIAFFSKNEIAKPLAEFATVMSMTSSDKEKMLSEVIDIFIKNGDKFDQNCQVNINWIGDQYLSLISNWNADKDIDSIFAITYRFVKEFELSITNDLSFELRKFCEYVERELSTFGVNAQRQIKFAQGDMLVQIFKKLVNNPVIENLTNIEKYAQTIDDKFGAWEAELTKRERRVQMLQESLGRYQHAYNFVGLFQGFLTLKNEKTRELKSKRRVVGGLGLFALSPMVYEVYRLSVLSGDLVWSDFLLGVIPLFSVTAVLLYYFRLTVQDLSKIKAQILQIDLRMTLCQFIQSYVEYIKEFGSARPDSLERFEALIFSGIVSGDDKIPAAYDGLESILGVIRSIKDGG